MRHRTKFPPELIAMFLDAGRFDFRIAVEKFLPGNEIDCYITPIPRVVGILPIHITAIAEGA